MPTRNQSWKPSHFFQNPNKKRKPSGFKYKKAIDWYIELLKKEKAWTMAKWVEKTKVKANARLKKFGITKPMIQKVADRRWLTDLLS